MKQSTFILLLSCLAFLIAGLLLDGYLVDIHRNGLAYWISSDGPEYYRLYDTYSQLGAFDQGVFHIPPEYLPALLSVGAPVILLAIQDGHIWLTIISNILFFGFALYSLLNALPGKTSRAAILAQMFLFPYTIPGLFSVNKEIWCISATLLFSTFLLTKKKRHLLLALFCAFLSRYYLLVDFLVIISFMYSLRRLRRKRQQRSLFILAGAAFSLSLPSLINLIPNYNAEEQVLADGRATQLFNMVMEHGLYIAAYPLKLIMLCSAKLLNFLTGNLDFDNRLFDHVELLVSVFSAIVLVRSLQILKHHPSHIVRQFLLIGLLSPFPLLWAPTYHWRYYIFSTVFLCVGLAINRENRAINTIPLQIKG
ncbi:hypothetical protein OL229_22290 [Neisseriaceae bacterium JH1-16]|nr:hypothetical protein [Neisseriaceae bacterium JH1-16]